MDIASMNGNIRKRSIGGRVFILILSLFVFVIFSFVFLYKSNDNKNRIENINQRLQDYNDRMYEVLQLQRQNGGIADIGTITEYINKHPQENMRVTLIHENGTVIFDSQRKKTEAIKNHANRIEFRKALKDGRGYDISRPSATVKGNFFYSATHYPADSLVIRTALPFDEDLGKDLSTDIIFMSISIIALIIVSVSLYRFINRVSNNVTQLRIFASKTNKNMTLNIEDLAKFSDDELGEISEHIVKLYIRLQKTKNEQNILKRQLTQNIAHELKTPIASIEGYLETILSSPDIDEETRTRFIKRCYDQSIRLGHLVNDISALNQMDDGMANIQFTKIDIAQQIRKIVNEVALELENRKMTFDLHIPPTMHINGNPSLIYSIFRNLTDNAIAYAGEGTTITLSATGHADNEAYLFRFSDNGAGVPQHHLERLFERFYRVDKGRSRKMGGTGLGLSIVKNAVLAHGGSIKVENNHSGGLCLTFTLRKNL